jgi:hypothetical protein
LGFVNKRYISVQVFFSAQSAASGSAARRENGGAGFREPFAGKTLGEGEPHMDAAITMKDAGLLILGIGLIILVFYAIYLVRHLSVTAKSVNKILADAEEISEIAVRRSKDMDKLIGNASESVGGLADILKGNQSTIAALTSIVNALSSLKNLIRDGKKKEGKQG